MAPLADAPIARVAETGGTLRQRGSSVNPFTLESAGATPTTRPNPYAAIHSALRRGMADTLARLGTLQASDPHALGAVLAQVQALLALLRRHALIENLFVHPAIEAVSPGATRATQDEHEQHLLAIGELGAECEALAARPEAAAAQRLHRHLARLVAENLTHMHDEEARLGPLLLAGYGDAELAAMEQRAAATVPPAEREALMRWLGGGEPAVAGHDG
jgi:hypothetical protein